MCNVRVYVGPTQEPQGDCSYARAVRVYVRSEAGQPLWLARFRSGYVCTYGVPLANI